MSVGYATLYGDMCGGYNVLKDVYKTEVFRLSHWRNAHHPHGALGPKGRVIPERIITKPPSAELRENQKDQDSLAALRHPRRHSRMPGRERDDVRGDLCEGLSSPRP
ncbi:MAG: hypothetical protein WDM89_17465 [Rhizomicrobium sp.]